MGKREEEGWKEVTGAIDSPTLERDFRALQDGLPPAGYTQREWELLEVADRFLRRKATIGELRAAVKAARGE